jgi:2-methylisocitrate lyase-like PEP mutase family enzyme
MPYNLQALPLAALKEAGVARVSLPVVAVFAALRAMTETLRSLRDTGDFADLIAENRLCGMDAVAALLKRP